MVSKRLAWPLNVGTESRCWTNPIASAAPCGSRASLPPDNGRLLSWLKVEIERLGVDVRLKTEASVASIRALNPRRRSRGHRCGS